MPKPAWYLVHTNPDPEPVANPLVAALLAELTDQPSSAHTATALQIAVTAAGQVGDAIAACHHLGSTRDLDRLITSLNRVAGQLAQTLQRLAYHANRRDLPGLPDAPDELVAQVTSDLANAGLYAELVAGHLKEAHLTRTRHQLAAQPTTNRSCGAAAAAAPYEGSHHDSRIPATAIQAVPGRRAVPGRAARRHRVRRADPQTRRLPHRAGHPSPPPTRTTPPVPVDLAHGRRAPGRDRDPRGTPYQMTAAGAGGGAPGERSRPEARTLAAPARRAAHPATTRATVH